jgi:predicted CopG family antitoxin
MATKTIGITDDVYNRLKARKQQEESFTELVDRLLDETTPEWRDGFGTLPEEDAADLEQIVTNSRKEMGKGLSKRQGQVLEAMANTEE